MATYDEELDGLADVVLSEFHDSSNFLASAFLELANKIANDEMFGGIPLDLSEDEEAEMQYYQILNEVLCNVLGRVIVKNRAFQKKGGE